ncbi:phage tail sheath C-terminal domain-containing protein [Kitasatospora sp. NPDC004745]|uniref:phage tail sheath C-terminal domain-containing protein n=1 Tax=Kitasatospora sp. NPDC004745 TaxID=3364019 RepID=UPI00367CF7D2
MNGPVPGGPSNGPATDPANGPAAARAAAPGLRLGAPGVYRDTRRPAPAPRPVRLDVAGFVGVAPRGPVDRPVAVERWTDYRRVFGGFEGPGLLPHAVRAFFAQGGSRAHVLRVSPLPRAPDPAALAAVARYTVRLAGPEPGAGAVELGLRAADEGSWGGRLAVRWEFDAAGQFTARADGTRLPLPDALTLPAGTLLRVRGPGLPPAGELLHVRTVEDTPPRGRTALLDRPPGAVPPDAGLTVDVVTATVTVTDADPGLARAERLTGLGLAAAHPRFVRRVLAEESRLIAPDGPWPERLAPPDASLPAVDAAPAGPGADRWACVTADSLFGDTPPELLPVGGDQGVDEDAPVFVGMDRLALEPEVALLSVPDLYWDYRVPPATTDPPEPPRPGADGRCPPPPVPLVYPAPPERAVLLDGRDPEALAEVLRRQRRLVDLAERQRRFVALLDVPPGLPLQLTARWRSGFDSSYAAAHHPWLGVVDPADPQQRAVLVPPSAFAAGITADREHRLGIPWGPANALAAGAVTAADLPGPAERDELHLLGVDVFAAEPDGFRLASARTLSRDPDYAQLSVRRLMTMLRLTLERQARGLAFEPDSPQLRTELTGTVTRLLRDLFRAGAFGGATEAQAFFVRCDEELNPAWSQGLGRLVAEIGVAPARPLEYLVLRIAQDADGDVRVAG